MATGKTGSERVYPNAGNASNKEAWNDGPGGRSYPGGRAKPKKSGKVKSCKVGNDAMPPGPAKPSQACCTEYRQEGSKREYSK